VFGLQHPPLLQNSGGKPHYYAAVELQPDEMLVSVLARFGKPPAFIERCNPHYAEVKTGARHGSPAAFPMTSKA
jgi:hypothetical protein